MKKIVNKAIVPCLKNCRCLSKIFSIFFATVSQRLVAATRSNYFLVADWSESRNSGCDWFIQLSDNRCPITPTFNFGRPSFATPSVDRDVKPLV